MLLHAFEVVSRTLIHCGPAVERWSHSSTWAGGIRQGPDFLLLLVELRSCFLHRISEKN